VARTGNSSTRLVVLRGNSASGKSTTARALRERLGGGIALIEQDYLRRVLLYEHDVIDGHNIGLIDLTVRYALDRGYDVILEGTFYTVHYQEMLVSLTNDHRGRTAHYYFDIPLEETIVRHRNKPITNLVSDARLRKWYNVDDLLRLEGEQIINENSSLHETVDRIAADLDWQHGPPFPHCL
jgi:predicted kinase